MQPHLNFNSGFGTRRLLWGLALVLSLLASGCVASNPAPASPALDPIKLFPASSIVPGWQVSQKLTTYNRDNLFNLVDGQAELFFAYGFEQVAVQRYQDSAGILMNVEIWQLATPADAYGLFSAGRTGGPVTIGNEADSDPGRRLAFWQDRYFVNLKRGSARSGCNFADLCPGHLREAANRRPTSRSNRPSARLRVGRTQRHLLP